MDSFSRSYFLNTRRKAGIACLPMRNSPTPRTGITTAKVTASSPPIYAAITTEKISISGQRIAVRISIIYAIWTLLTSVVSRVTSDEDEKWSMFVKVKDWTLWNRSCRKFFAKPDEAFAQVKPAKPPHASEHIAISARTRPIRTTYQTSICAPVCAASDR